MLLCGETGPGWQSIEGTGYTEHSSKRDTKNVEDFLATPVSTSVDRSFGKTELQLNCICHDHIVKGERRVLICLGENNVDSKDRRLKENPTYISQSLSE